MVWTVEWQILRTIKKLSGNYSCMLNPIGLTHKGSISQDHYLEPAFAYADWVIVHVSDSIISLSNK